MDIISIYTWWLYFSFTRHEESHVEIVREMGPSPSLSPVLSIGFLHIQPELFIGLHGPNLKVPKVYLWCPEVSKGWFFPRLQTSDDVSLHCIQGNILQFKVTVEDPAHFKIWCNLPHNFLEVFIAHGLTSKAVLH